MDVKGRNNLLDFLFTQSFVLCLFFFLTFIFSFTLFSQGKELVVKSDTILIQAKSPSTASIRSAILPGLGQFYNDKYWKIPIIYGIGLYFAYEYINFDKDFNNYSNLFNASKSALNPTGNYGYKQYREYYRDMRDSFLWYFGLLYLLNILDAYVDAHLFSFNVDNNYSLDFKPSYKIQGIKVKINF